MPNLPKEHQRISIAITGASGVQYSLRLIEVLLKADYPLNVVISKAALLVFAMEMDVQLGNQPQVQKERLLALVGVDKPDLLRIYGVEDWSAPMASGSNTSRAMVIVPTTTGALSAVATGQSNNLIERAADVMLKERKPLVIVLRETPLNAIHIKNMLTLTEAGAIVMPANPGFYHRPKSVDDIIDFMVARILDQLNIEHDLMNKWGDDSSVK
ncbi:flavin prenyltransferase UbiX [Wohlfahrtiimonas chitiniclastica]|uniref:flavin prenyltransferase UbiX n=1 Tax=Wohlfahrtiimonas chitiniclastica TaxID=400946 RepID=UPI001BD08D93|nr:flavin prenyltransferase UbiX [Wohlfahrtiimonas chitiniclastica]MBS7815025.1 UbiX family flavin prenyltransferase [Wohlfahrtiimonas chitiniclastica]MDC7251224.1 flavin prenyltransferase UbiX [Wohlfahrtiimonas chitiniclastica]